MTFACHKRGIRPHARDVLIVVIIWNTVQAHWQKIVIDSRQRLKWR
jgi:hypothetical protein